MLFIQVSRRIGAGIVRDGHVFRRKQSAAGLIGSLPVTSGGHTESLDAPAGSDMIQREGIAAANKGRSAILADILRRGGEITAIEVSQAIQVGDAASGAILATSGDLIGQFVATLANALNPDLIVLSGSIKQTDDILLAAVRETVHGASHSTVTGDLQIIRSQMGSSAGLAGAARVASESLLPLTGDLFAASGRRAARQIAEFGLERDWWCPRRSCSPAAARPGALHRELRHMVGKDRRDRHSARIVASNRHSEPLS